MLFVLKKWIGGLLMPLPLFLCIFFVALLILFFTQKQKLARLLLLFSFIFIFLFSSLPVIDKFAHPLERKHLPILEDKRAQNLDYILLLGSHSIADPSLPVNSQLSSTAISRFFEAFMLYRANPEAILVVSGAAFGDNKSIAELERTLAMQVGIAEENILVLNESLDTDDEAKKMSELIRGKRAALVTSATHMDRALRLFYQYGTAPIAAPTNYIAKNRVGETPAYYYIPSAYQLHKSKLIWHEYLGRAQTWIKNIL